MKLALANNTCPINSTKNKGFSLVEVMVAMAIMALIGVGALSVLDTATKTSGNIKQDGERLNNVQRAFLFLSTDMQQLTMRQVRDEYGDKVASMKSDLQASAPYIRLTKLGRRNPALLPRSNLEHLIYSVEDKTLYRTSFTYPDGMTEESGLKRPILEGVEDMKINFYDGEEWHDYWPLTEGNQDGAVVSLPVALKLNLELTDYGMLERLFVLSDKPEKDDAVATR
jgi:general secretion pathway protein J